MSANNKYCRGWLAGFRIIGLLGEKRMRRHRVIKARIHIIEVEDTSKYVRTPIDCGEIR